MASSGRLLSQLCSILSANGITITPHYSSSISTIELERRIQERDSSSATITPLVQRQDTPTLSSLARLTQKLHLGRKDQKEDQPSDAKDSATQSQSQSLPDPNSDWKEISYQDWNSVCDAFKSLADACRSNDSPRAQLCQTTLPQIISQSLSYALDLSTSSPSSLEKEVVSDNLSTELLRSIANLCIDNDWNRSVMLSFNIPNKILQILQLLIEEMESLENYDSKLKTLKKLRTTLGCFLNLQMEHVEIKKNLLKNSLKSSSSNSARFQEKDFLSILLRISTSDEIYSPASWCPSLNLNQSTTPFHESLDDLLLASTVSKWAFRILTDLLTPLESSKTPETPSDDGTDSMSNDDEEIESVNEMIKKVKFNASSDPEIVKWILKPLQHFLKRQNQQAQSDEPETSRLFKIPSEQVDELIDSDAEILSNLSEFWNALTEDCCLEFKLRMIHPLPSSTSSTPSTSVRPSTGSIEESQAPLKSLMNFIEFSSPPREWDPESSTDGRIENPEDAEAALESIKAFSINKSLISKSLILIISEDKLMDKLFHLKETPDPTGSGMDGDNWFVEKCLDWLNLGLENQRQDLITLGILFIGNLARKNENCIKLLELTGIKDVLFSLLNSILFPSESDSSKEEIKASSEISSLDQSKSKSKSKSSALPSSENLKIIHSILGLLKNLSIPKINKLKLVKKDFIELVSECLDSKFDKIQPIQFLTVGVLKNLAATGSGEGGIRIAQHQNVTDRENGDGSGGIVLQKILDLIARSEDLPIRLEASRILVNSIKSLWSPSSDGSDQGSRMDDHRLEQSRKIFMRRKVTNVLCGLVRDCEKYPILINEGIFALTLLASSERGARLVAISLTQARQPKASIDEAEAETSNASSEDSTTGISMINSILSLKNKSIPIEFVINSCSLINSLANTQAQPQSTISEDEALALEFGSKRDQSQTQTHDQVSDPNPPSEWKPDFETSEVALDQIEKTVRKSLQNLIDDTVSPREVLKPAHTALQSCGKRFNR